MKYDHLLAYEGEDDVCCAHCGNAELQIGQIDLYVQGYLENDPGIHISVDCPETMTTMVTDAGGSPFAQGNGVALTLWCGKCRNPTGLLIGSPRGYVTQVSKRQRVEKEPAKTHRIATSIVETKK